MEQEENSRNLYKAPDAAVADVSRPLGRSAAVSTWVRWLLYAQIFVLIIALISGFLEQQLLSGYTSGESSEQAPVGAAASEINDVRQALVGLVQSLIYIASGILILVWIRRANAESRRLGADGMEFTPGWSIGWYFVPVVNLWLPYKALREIWQTSADPKHWQYETWPALLPWWWFLWIVSNLLGNATFRLSLKAESLEQLATLSTVTLASDAIEIPLCIVFLVIVSRIDAMQSAAELAGTQALNREA